MLFVGLISRLSLLLINRQVGITTYRALASRQVHMLTVFLIFLISMPACKCKNLLRVSVTYIYNNQQKMLMSGAVDHKAKMVSPTISYRVK